MAPHNLNERRLADAWAELQAHANEGNPLKADAYRLAFADPEFLLRRETRGIRFQLEMLKPDLAQRDAGIENTIVVFGSARFREASEAQEQLVRAERSGDAREIARASAMVRNAHYYTHAREFARTVVERDRQGGTPKTERDALRNSGLLALSIPREFGGLGADWAHTFEVVRTLARVDSSLAHVFGFHHLMLATVRLFGAPAQWQPWFELTARKNWFWGNALNPLDTRTIVVASHNAANTCSSAVERSCFAINAHQV